MSLSVSIGVADVRFDEGSNASLTFLLRAWQTPKLGQRWIMILLGVVSIGRGFLISYAYRRNEAAFATPFESVAIVIAIMWGHLIFMNSPMRPVG